MRAAWASEFAIQNTALFVTFPPAIEAR